MTWSQSGKWPDDLGPKMRAGLTQAGDMVGKALVLRVKQGMTGGHSGNVYTTFFRTKGTGGGRRIFPVGSRSPHQASAAGEYSAVDTGKLLASVQYQVSGASYIRFFANANHAGYQEFGTDKIAARKNLKRAIDESDATILQILEQIIWRAIG